MNTLIVLMSTVTWGAPLTEADILGQADARIEQHRKGDAVLKLVSPADKPVASDSPVRIEQTRHAFLFGCNIFKLGKCKTPEDNAAYEKHYAELLNFGTLPFYWWAYERERSKPDDARTEEIVRWCKAHNVTSKGHPLAWNWVDPGWLPDDPEIAMKIQFSRIKRCVRRFKKDITIWDVVNEATHYDRPEPKEKAPKLTEAITKMGVGEYVRQAFKAARLANPEATLIINDYRTDPAYAEKIISQLVDEDGRPLYDVIGIQSHQHGGAWPVTKIWEVCERFGRFGKPLHFTETTFLSGQVGWDLKKKSKESSFKWESTPEGEKRQAAEAVRFYTVLFSHPAVEAVTWWDFTDQSAWQGAPAGLLRADMTPKPVYEQLKKLIKGKWWTKTNAKSRENGEVRFRGLFGDYKNTVGSGDRQMTGTFSFDKETTLPVEVRLK